MISENRPSTFSATDTHRRCFVDEMASFRAVSRLIRPITFRLEHAWPPGPADRIATTIAALDWKGRPTSAIFDVVPSRQRLDGRGAAGD